MWNGLDLVPGLVHCDYTGSWEVKRLDLSLFGFSGFTTRDARGDRYGTVFRQELETCSDQCLGRRWFQ